MVLCFLCLESFTNLKVLKQHFDLIHNTTSFELYKCAEVNCQRSFHEFDSFKKHYTKSHCNNVSQDVQTPSTSISPPCNESYDRDRTACNSLTPLRPLEQSLATFVASMYSNYSLPRNTVQEVVSGLNGLFCSFIEEIKELQSAEISTSTVNEMNMLVKSSIAKFDTETKRINYYKNKGYFIEPEVVVIGQRLDRRKCNGTTSIQTVPCVEHFIPLRHILQKFLSLKNVFSDILKYIELLNQSTCNNMENFIQGTYWKNRQNSHSSKTVLPLFMYFDDFEVGNPLGSHAGVHKLGAVYVSLPSLPHWRSSVLSNIFITLLFHSADRVSFGNRVVFKPLIDEFNFLSESGVSIDTPSFKGTVYFELALILGDNLGLHSITGFVESFSANYSCRTCKAPKQLVSKQCYEDTSLLRDSSSYHNDLSLANPPLTGIKERCVWLDVKNFDLFNQVGVDIMHDILEGVAKYVMSFMMVQYIQRLKLFSLSTLNDLIVHFSYGEDDRNKPCAFDLEHLKRGTIRLSAAEMLSFVRYFGLIVGHFVPKDDCIWNLWITLRKILDIILGCSVSSDLSDYLQILVAELNEMYVSLSNEPLKPKFHNMIHYHSIMKKHGPLSAFWSMRFEAKHHHSKLAARPSNNRKNITFSLIIKHLFHLNEIFAKGILNNVLSVGPSKNISSHYSYNILLELGLSTSETLVQVPWAKMSSTRYRVGSVLVLKFNKDDYLITFFVVTGIYLKSPDHLIFTGSVLNTLYFDEHYYAYKVEFPSIEQHIIVSFVNLFSPIPNTKVTQSDGDYVILRSSL